MDDDSLSIADENGANFTLFGQFRNSSFWKQLLTHALVYLNGVKGKNEINHWVLRIYLRRLFILH